MEATKQERQLTMKAKPLGHPEIRWSEDSLTVEYDYGSMNYIHRFKKVLEDTRTPIQRMRALQHAAFGKVAVLGDDIMSSTSDEEKYDNQAISMIREGEPRRTVLILGGGDLSLAARLDPDPAIERIIVCEMDAEVPNFFARHFPGCRRTPKLDLRIGDAFATTRDVRSEVDLVFDDMFIEPHGCAGNTAYHELLAKMFPGKLVISQTGSVEEGEADKILAEVCVFDPNAQQTTAFIDSFQEMWSWTSYRL